MMIEREDENIKILSKLPLAELRQRQDMVANWFKQYRGSTDSEQFETVFQMERDLMAAVDLKVFGDA